MPAFEPADGRFAGYRGVARREEAMPPPAGSVPAPPSPDHDSLREMVHEIKTPLNAIIGFAEIIDGQYLGPAHRSYRERAAEIVGQARTLLERDRRSRLRRQAPIAAARARARGTDFAEILPRLTEEFAAYAALTRRGNFDPRWRAIPALRARSGAGRAPRSPLRRERGRRCQPVRGACAGHRVGKRCARSAVTRPLTIYGASEEQLFDPAFALSADDKARLDRFRNAVGSRPGTDRGRRFAGRCGPSDPVAAAVRPPD